MSAPPLLVAAYWYAQADWPAFPVEGKRPLRGSRGLHDATTDACRLDARIRRAARSIDRSLLGIAIATGYPLKGGGHLLVVDVDTKHDGDSTLAKLEEEHGEIPPTWTVRTPSNGLHFYLRTEQPLRNTAGGLGEGIDTRGRGGYVVAPPSPGYTVATRQKVADAPEWIVERLTPKLRVFPEPRPDAPVSLRYVATAIERECGAVAAAREGERNTTLHRAAIALSRFVFAGQADEAGVIRALTIAATFAGLPEREIERTIDSAFEWRQGTAA